MTSGMCSERTWQLLQMLADGKFHSGQALAEQLGLSRASIFNALNETADHGIALQRIRGRGYRLAQPWDQLKKEEVLRGLDFDAAKFNIEIFQQGISSNTMLLQRSALGAPSGSVVAIEMQTAGRGRLGRTWHSGLGGGLTFSMLWRFDCGINALSGLSLAVGVAVVRALSDLGARGVQLKWPNDILTENGKLGGVLIESQGDMLGPCAVVIGIGLNYILADSIAKKIDQPASALNEVCTNMPTRSQLLATLLRELAGVLREFVTSGFPSLRQEWEQYHAYQNRMVRLHMPDGSEIIGTAIGITDAGELRLDTEQGMKCLNSGEVGAMR
jgi:BirA family biotin operon repressor/biotin-[acetyl-CoA-carboxylase] ligase